MLKRKVNVYLSAEQAIKLGIADEILWGKQMSELSEILKNEYKKKETYHNN